MIGIFDTCEGAVSRKSLRLQASFSENFRQDDGESFSQHLLVEESHVPSCSGTPSCSVTGSSPGKHSRNTYMTVDQEGKKLAPLDSRAPMARDVSSSSS